MLILFFSCIKTEYYPENEEKCWKRKIRDRNYCSVKWERTGHNEKLRIEDFSEQCYPIHGYSRDNCGSSNIFIHRSKWGCFDAFNQIRISVSLIFNFLLRCISDANSHIFRKQNLLTATHFLECNEQLQVLGLRTKFENYLLLQKHASAALKSLPSEKWINNWRQYI